MKRALLQKHLIFIAIFLAPLFWARATLNASNTTKLFYGALKASNTAQVEEYLTENPQLANTPYKKYVSPLFAAENEAIAQLLLKHKSNPNVIDPMLKISAFYIFLVQSSRTKNFTTPQIFINSGVDITLPHYITNTSSPLIATIWTQQTQDWDCVIHWFVQQCKNPNAQDEQKRSLLHWAVHYEQFVNVCTLLKRNADPNTKDIFGESPFSLTLKKCVLKQASIKVPFIFLAHGADPKTRYKKENLIHFFLTYCKNKEDIATIIKYLIERGVDPLEPDLKGVLPSVKAEKLGFDEVKKLLKKQDEENAL